MNHNWPVKVTVGRVLETQLGSNDNRSEVFFANDTIDGITNPDYKVLISKKIDASTPYHRVVNTVELQPLRGLSTSFGNVYSNFVGTFPANLSPITIVPVDVQADNKAISILRNKLNEDAAEFKTLIPLGEIRETRHLISSVAHSTANVLRSLIDIKRRPRDAVRRASDAWLTFAFGVRPTIIDANALINTIGRIMNANASSPKRYTGTAETISWTYANDVPQFTGGSGFDFLPLPSRSEQVYKVQYVAGVLLKLQSANSYDVNQQFGLNFGDIVGAAWELVPYSWVVDYFTTAGQYFEDTFSSPAGNTVYCTKSVKVTKKQTQDFRVVPIPSTYSLVYSSTPQSKCYSMDFRRTVLTALPHRSFAFKSVDRIGLNSVNKLLNLASVLLK